MVCRSKNTITPTASRCSNLTGIDFELPAFDLRFDGEFDLGQTDLDLELDLGLPEMDVELP